MVWFFFYFPAFYICQLLSCKYLLLNKRIYLITYSWDRGSCLAVRLCSMLEFCTPLHSNDMACAPMSCVGSITQKNSTALDRVLGDHFLFANKDSFSPRYFSGSFFLPTMSKKTVLFRVCSVILGVLKPITRENVFITDWKADLFFSIYC